MIRRWSAIWLITAIVLCDGGTLSSQTDADWHWVEQHFGQVLDRLMPLQRTAGYYVVYRANRDYRTDVSEYWFMIGYDSKSGGYGLQPFLSAHVRAADASSIYDQLMSMHRSNAQEDAASMSEKIRLRVVDFTETTCPSIKKQIEKLEQLQSQMPKLTTNIIVLHPMNHAFHMQTPDGDMSFTIWDDEHPLVRWATETRLALDACAKAK